MSMARVASDYSIQCSVMTSPRDRHDFERSGFLIRVQRSKFYVQIDFSAKHIAQIVGNLAEKEMKPGQPLRGVLVRKGDRDLVMHPEDLPLFTKLNTGGVKHRQVSYHRHANLLKRIPAFFVYDI